MRHSNNLDILLTNYMQYYIESNERAIVDINNYRWLLLEHSGLVDCAENLYLSGSREHGVNYPESDADLIIVYANETELNEKTLKLGAGLEKLKELKPEIQVKVLKTGNNLPWYLIKNVTIDNVKTKIEIVFRPIELHQKIQAHMTEQVAKLFDTDEKKLEYIETIRAAFLLYSPEWELFIQMQDQKLDTTEQKAKADDLGAKYRALKKWTICN